MNILKLSILTAFLFMAGCSTDRIAGNTSSETTNGVVAVIHNPDGAAAAGAVVRLRRADYLAAVPSLSKTSGIIGIDARTDSNGCVRITGIDSGSYALEISDPGMRRALLLPCTVADTVVNLGTATVRPYATVTGSIQTTGSTSSSRYVQVYGMERLVVVGATGVFTIGDLPAGTLRLRIVLEDTTRAPLTIDSVRTVAGSTTDIPMADWQFSKRLYLNTTLSGANVAGDVAGFPLLVRLDSAAFGSAAAASLYFGQMRDSGQDIRFVNSLGVLLPHEIEQWDRVKRQAVLWVGMDTVHGNDSAQYLTVYWGNQTVGMQSRGDAVFDTADGFSAVWHLGQEAAGTSGASVYRDATANAFHGADFVSATGQTGIIGNGHRLNRLAGDYIDLGQNRNFVSGASQVTLEAWCNVDSNDSAGMILTHSLDNPADPGLSYAYIMVHGRVTVGARISAAGPVDQTISTTQRLIPGNWNHIVAVIKYDTDSAYIYVNGTVWSAGIISFDATATVGAVSTMSVAGSQEQPHQAFFGGMLDELRTQRVGRNAAWVKLSYENQRADQKLNFWK